MSIDDEGTDERADDPPPRPRHARAIEQHQAFRAQKRARDKAKRLQRGHTDVKGRKLK